MPVRPSASARNAAVDAVAALINGGAGPGTLKIYTGAQPATPATAPSGTLLAEFTLSDPAFAPAAGGSAALDVTPALSDTGNAAGNAGWARFADSNAVGVLDGECGTSGEMVNLDTLAITLGGTVNVTSGSITLPAEGV